MERTHSFGYWLRRRRKALDLTQAALAERVFCSADLIRKLEGDARRPSRELAAHLADALGLTGDERAAFVQVARAERAADQLALDAAPAELPVPAHSPSNLPTPPSALLGRSDELVAIIEQIEAGARLLTLTGPGGVGKTRLALEAAHELASSFLDGAWFVDLAPIRNEQLVIGTIAQTLGLREAGGRPIVSILKEYLRDRRALLLLDNCEQVLGAAAQIADLLADAPELHVLATSRAALHLRAERELAVEPLALPDLDALPPPEQLARSPAVALFLACTRAVGSNVRLTAENAPAVAAICARLDGLPLAIELAASRSKLFAPRALLEHLSHRLDLLSDGPRDLPARQQTIRDTLAWSYELLEEAEQRLFRQLAVFVGGCTLEAAIDVLSAERLALNDQHSQLKTQSAELKTFEGLTALIDHSLLRSAAQANGTTRLSMLETVREYALEQLEASGEAAQARHQHARYYAQLAGSIPETDEERFKQTFSPEYENLCAAMEWSLTPAEEPDLALQIADTLESLSYVRGLRRETIGLIERALHHPRGSGNSWRHAAMHTALAQLLGLTGDYAKAQQHYEAALPLLEASGDHKLYAWTIGRLGWLARERGDSATAWARLRESVERYRALDRPAGAAWALATLAEVAVLDEDPAQAEALLEEAHAAQVQAGDHTGWDRWALNHGGHAAQLRGDFARARQMHQQALAICLAGSDQSLLPWAYQSLGECALGQGQPAEARQWLRLGLKISRQLDDRASIAWILASFGTAAALDEEPAQAARLWGAAEQQRQALGCRPAPAARATYERLLAAVRAQLGEPAFSEAWATGQALTHEQALEEAAQI